MTTASLRKHQLQSLKYKTIVELLSELKFKSLPENEQCHKYSKIIHKHTKSVYDFAVCAELDLHNMDNIKITINHDLDNSVSDTQEFSIYDMQLHEKINNSLDIAFNSDHYNINSRIHKMIGENQTIIRMCDGSTIFHGLELNDDTIYIGYSPIYDEMYVHLYSTKVYSIIDFDDETKIEALSVNKSRYEIAVYKYLTSIEKILTKNNL